MGIDAAQIIPDGQMRLLDRLESLLKRQLELAQQGDSASKKFEALTSQADLLVREIASLGILDSDKLRGRCSQLQRLYGALCLVVAAQRAGVSEELSRIRKGRRVVAVYHENV